MGEHPKPKFQPVAIQSYGRMRRNAPSPCQGVGLRHEDLPCFSVSNGAGFNPGELHGIFSMNLSSTEINWALKVDHDARMN